MRKYQYICLLTLLVASFIYYKNNSQTIASLSLNPEQLKRTQEKVRDIASVEQKGSKKNDRTLYLQKKSIFRQAKSKAFIYEKIAPKLKKDQKLKVTSGHREFYLLPGYYAIVSKNLSFYDYDEVIETKGIFTIVKSSESPKNGYKIVENSKTGELGLFTGDLKVMYKDEYNHELFSDFDYINVKTYESIKLAIYHFDSSKNALLAMAKHSSNPLIKKIDFEIIEHFKSAR